MPSHIARFREGVQLKIDLSNGSLQPAVAVEKPLIRSVADSTYPSEIKGRVTHSQEALVRYNQN